MKKELKRKDINEEVSNEAKRKLIEVLNDSPSINKLKDAEIEITALKMGTKWKICEVFKEYKLSEPDTENVIIAMANNIPVLVKIITLAILNDKDRIRNEYEEMYQTIMWNCTESDLTTLFMDIIGKLDTDFFFANIKSTKIFLKLTADRRMLKEERDQLSLEQN